MFLKLRQKSLVVWLPVMIFIMLLGVTACLSIEIKHQDNARIASRVEGELTRNEKEIANKLTVTLSALDRMAGRLNIPGRMPISYWENDAKLYARDLPYLLSFSLIDDKGGITEVVSPGQEASSFDRNTVLQEEISDFVKTASPGPSQLSKIFDLNGDDCFLYLSSLSKRDDQGYLLTLVDVDKVLASLETDIDRPDYEIIVREKGREIHTNQDHDVSPDNHFKQAMPLQVRSLHWTIEAAPTALFMAKKGHLVSTGIPIIGLLISGSLTLCAYLALKWLGQSSRLRASQALNNAVLAYAAQTIIATDLAGKILIFNKTAENLLGYKATEVIGRLTPSLWHDPVEIGRRAAELSTELDYLVEPGFDALTIKARIEGAEAREWTYITKDGSRFPVELTVTVMRDEKDTPIGYIGIGQNITEQKKQQQALITSEQTFRTAMESASIGVAIVSSDGKWQVVNDSLCKIVGYDRSSMLAMGTRDLTHPDDLPNTLSRIQDLYAGVMPYYMIEKRYRHADGHYVDVQLDVSLVKDAEGRPDFMIAQIQDISSRKEMDRVKNEFISVVSHELRTPLTSIRGSLGLIAGALSKDLPEQVVQLVSIAHKNAERLILLINDILDMDKIAAGQMRFDMKPEILAVLLLQAIEANRDYVQKFNVEMALAEIPPGLAINIDANRFIQVMSNLLSNAAKFSAPHTTVDSLG